MKYNDLTINQKITLKMIMSSEKERKRIGISESVGKYMIVVRVLGWKTAIEHFLNN